MYLHRSTLGPVDLAFTDRYGGVSGVPYAELNLAQDDADDASARSENLRRVVTDFAPDLVARPDAGVALPVAQMRQVHGTVVDLVEDRRSPGLPEADAMVTARPGVVLLVRAADCVPVVLADPEHQVIAVAHAGRRGMVDGIAAATVSRMRDSGASSIRAWIGPSICGACYEVPAAMQAEVGALVPAAVSTTSWGTPALDIGAGVRAQLEAAGVTVVDVATCTRESADLYSYRRDGAAAGRHAGLIRLHPKGTR
ncbi:peptidoglycan editing factor PgeF [Nocardioides marmoriginsengisoli]|uniref:Purine nucleoside phosphorylase n=1 Tax=Nocardioides marmoriginsengisoli TaxID=661483 RepID=A0A3N0CPN4_9ACTN|nr:peptidoglycan editing factor PgeF [Nocardioides marmoriginsengisoli]RNL64996.1 peptidoglycan editing factor PgeF [Nocardioides marmoriginsengisoli]